MQNCQKYLFGEKNSELCFILILSIWKNEFDANDHSDKEYINEKAIHVEVALSVQNGHVKNIVAPRET